MDEKTLTFLERVEMNLPVTAQEVFDQAVGGVIRQGRQSGEEDEAGFFRCLYRGPLGGACAIGQCIPDSMYQRHMEAHSADEMNNKGWVPKSLQTHMALLRELQDAHDSESGHEMVANLWVELFKARAKKVAVEFGFGLTWNF